MFDVKYVSLSELSKVRIMCPACQTAIEMRIEKLGPDDNGKLDNTLHCPGCSILIRGERKPNALDGLDHLAEGLRLLASAGDQVVFVLPTAK